VPGRPARCHQELLCAFSRRWRRSNPRADLSAIAF
jgi:hypothetical protein